MPYILQCAWCSTILGTKTIPGAGYKLEAVTHGICPPCFAVVIHNIQKGRRDSFATAPEVNNAKIDLREENDCSRSHG
jgi:hypothetical protein